MKRLARMITLAAGAVLFVCAAPVAPVDAGESAHAIYTRAMARERQLRDGSRPVTLTQVRNTVRTYELVVSRYPRSGYSDNALWHAANLALLAFERFKEERDRETAVGLLTRLKDQYPASSLVVRASQLLRELPVDAPRAEPEPDPGAQAQPAVPSSAPVQPPASAPMGAAAATAGEAQRDITPAASDADGQPSGIATIREIKRTPLPDGIRVSIELDGESFFRSEQLENPRRVFFDLRATRAVPALRDATLKFTDDVVRVIRLGRHPNNTTRIVMDMHAVESYSVFTLYNPYRVVVDFRRAALAKGPEPVEPAAASAAPPAVASENKSIPASKEPVPLISRPIAATAVPPSVPTTNSNGQFSLARQLGLGVSRVVLDAGHGGHDPGARANGLTEAELVLDVTLRLRALLEKQPGFEVTLTRDSDQFIPLEERTAIANRSGADLFLSIHANASRNAKARGIETYFLNFASNPEAEAVAARENSGSIRTMRALPEIVRAIALNNKIDESRDFAAAVQKAMARRLVTRGNGGRDLGVKQAPFVVLIGAGMPSVLAEISFVTNRQEAALLKTAAYRQQIAEALFDAILRYQRSLKAVRAIAAKE